MRNGHRYLICFFINKADVASSVKEGDYGKR